MNDETCEPEPKKLKKSVNIGPTFVAKFDDKHYQKSGHGAWIKTLHYKVVFYAEC